MKRNRIPRGAPWLVLRCAAAAVAVISPATPAPGESPPPREGVSIHDGWRFRMGDPDGDPVRLCCDVWPETPGGKGGGAARREPAAAGGPAATRVVLKPWILPTGNEFLSDPASRHVRPAGNPGGGIDRNVWLTNTGPVHVARWGTRVTTREVSSASATVDVEAAIDNRSAAGAAVGVSIQLFTLDDAGRATGAGVAAIGPLEAPVAAERQFEVLREMGCNAIRTPPQYPAFHARFPGMLILGSENAAAPSSRGEYLFPVIGGAGAPVRDGIGGEPRRRHVSACELHTADIGSSMDRVFASEDRHPFVAGGFAWSGWDHLGDPTDMTPSPARERAAFNGLCLAIARGVAGAPGTVRLRAEPGALGSATVTLCAAGTAPAATTATTIPEP